MVLRPDPRGDRARLLRGSLEEPPSPAGHVLVLAPRARPAASS